MVYSVLVGGGIRFFARAERRVDLELVETRSINGRVVYLRYRVARELFRPLGSMNGMLGGTC